MDFLIQVLYVVTTALLVPVMGGLLLLLGWALLSLGGVVREAWERRGRARARRFSLVPDPERLPSRSEELEALFASSGAGGGFVAVFGARARGRWDEPRALRRLLDEIEVEAAARLSHLTLGARVGPMLGLMGTLIPLGPSLIGLSEGRVDTLAANLVVAFSTTVVGLLVGVLCYAMLHARRHWYARDLCHLESVCEGLEARSQA